MRYFLIKFERRCAVSRGEIERIHGEAAANVQASLAVGSAGRSCEIVLRGVSRQGGAAGREKFGDMVEERQQRDVAESRKDRPAQSVQVKIFHFINYFELYISPLCRVTMWTPWSKDR